jgi:uncharacterized protein YbjT (DUF2867 family)
VILQRNCEFMQSKSALILGASGLVGSNLLQLLLESPSIHQVRALVRRSLHISHPKLEEVIVDFNDMDMYRKNFGKGDLIFSCVGTTMKKVKGDKQLYKQIDFDIPVNAARFGIEAGYRHYVLISAHLANAQSLIFYNRLKGEIEEIIATFPFQSIHIFRPSFLMGNRKEMRWIEGTFGKLMQKISSLLPDAYKPVEVDKLAKAMLKAVLLKQNGLHYYTYKEIAHLQQTTNNL